MDRKKCRKTALLTAPFLASLLVLLAISISLAGTATLSWKANTESDLAGYRVYYGTLPRTADCPPKGYLNVVDVGKATSYTLSNLGDGVTYYLSLTAYDKSGNESCYSAQVSKVMPSKDVTPPTVSITAPAAGSTLSGTVTVTANASDNVGVAGVQFKLDGSNLGTERTSSPYSISWDTKTASSTSHTITAVARDAAGNQTTSSGVTLTVKNDVTPPTVSITAPAVGSVLSGTVTVSASASDNVGVAGVQFKLDGTNLGTEIVSSPYSISWDTKTASSASHTLTAVARDAAGNQATASGVTLTVKNDVTPPTVSITAPAVGSVLSGTVTVSAKASLNAGIAGLQFKLDGVNLGTEFLSAPYSISWDTKTASSASHTLTAVARDAAGNQTTSSGVTVTVKNNYTISATAGSGGSISPSGSVIASAGANLSFTITPNSGYKISSVTVDGAAVGAISSYTFRNITANHTIQTSFAPSTPGEGYKLIVTYSGSGTGAVYTNLWKPSYPAGTRIELTANPDTGSTFGGWSGACSGTAPTCTAVFNSDIYVTATFLALQKNYTIAAAAGSGGSISPSGSVIASAGANLSFTITPNSGYKISSVTIDGAAVGAVSSYTFRNITANHTIQASFAPSTSSYTITVEAGSHGSISPSASVIVNAGANLSFTISPSSGYKISSVTVDGAAVGAVSSYTFNNVTANHTIQASFAPSTPGEGYKLTVTYSGSGSGIVTLNQWRPSWPPGTRVDLTANPDTGSTFGGWSGACSGTAPTCTAVFNSDITVTATFNKK